MEKNLFNKWEPIPDLPNQIYLEGLHDDYEGFRLLLRGSSDRSKMLRISFSSVLVYRNIDEGNLLFFEGEDVDKKFGEWPFFIVTDSSLAKWFHQVSQEIYEDRPVKHYAVYTANDCVDIIAASEPTVEWL